MLLAAAEHARPRLGVAGGIMVLVIAATMLGVRVFAARIDQPFPAELMTSLPLAGGVLIVVGIAMLRWRSLPAQAAGLLLALALLHAAATPLIKAQFDFTPTANMLGCLLYTSRWV